MRTNIKEGKVKYMNTEDKNKHSLLDIANELFKDSRSLTPEEQRAINDYFRSKSKPLWVVRVKEDEDKDETENE